MQTYARLTVVMAGVLSATFLVGAAVFAQTNNAQYLGDTIPATMIPGFRYNVMVTFKNTGTTTWTGDTGYKLWCTDGYNFEVYHNEVGFDRGEIIAPGQDKTFSMSFHAPSPGTYTTGWRVIKEGVGAFGDTCMKQVVCAFGPNAPGTPTILWPTHGMTIGSNRPDIMIQGDPCDGYEVHIGTADAPESNDGWDSGIVSLNPGPGPDSIAAMSGVLNTQAYYYVFARLRNTHGWGPWSAAGDVFYTAGQLLDDPYIIAASGLEWWESVAYNPDRNEYCITWQNGYVIHWRRLDGTGAMIGSEYVISDGITSGHHYDAVCYNSTRQEYLILYSGWMPDNSHQMRVLRIDATTGNQIGSTIWLDSIGTNSTTGGLEVAYSPTSNSYLATYESYTEGKVYGRILDSTANLVGSRFQISTAGQLFSRNPAIAWNSASNEYLVTYMGSPTGDGFDYYAQRVRASDGALLGSNLALTTDHGCGVLGGGVAYDSDMNRYLVVYHGGSSSPTGQFVSSTATLIGSSFALGGVYTAGGMTSVTWNSTTKEYLATWAGYVGPCSYPNWGRRISQTGAYIGEAFKTNGNEVGFGNWSPIPVYNSVNNEYLIHWYNSYAKVEVRRYKTLPPPPVDPTGPGPVTSFVATPGDSQVQLTWHNPSDSDFVGTIIVCKTGSYPANAFDGTVLADFWADPSSNGSYTHTGLTNKTTYYYGAYSHDIVNFGTAATARAAPRDTTPPAPVTGFTATSAGNQIDLSWTNPADSDFTGTMIRFKYTGYPASKTDGYLLCDRAVSPGSQDMFAHTGVGNATYYYSAFAHDDAPNYSTSADAQATADCFADQYLADSFDSYGDSNLGGQGSWTTTGAASAQVESSFVKGGSGKSVLMDAKASDPLSIGNEIAFGEKTSGYYYVNLDVAQDAAGTAGAHEIASVAFYGSSSGTEIAKLHIQKGKITVEHGSGSITLIVPAANATWYNVGIGFDVDGRTMNFWFDGVPRSGSYAWKGTGTNLSRVVISSDRNANLSTQKAYVDNLRLDIMPGTAAQVTDDGAWTPSSSKLHFSFTAPACAGEYHYCIGTTSGGSQAREWTGCGSSTDVIATGLSLVDNQTYYVTVQAGTGHGTWGASKTTDGIKVAPAVTIPVAKALADGSPLDTKAIRGKVVSASFSGCFYIEDPDRWCAIKIVSSTLVSEGDVVDICGVMKGTGSERYIDCSGNPVIR